MKITDRFPHEAEQSARAASRRTPDADGGLISSSQALREGCVR